jgi:CRISPR-associated endonuclease/helicase Cas3
MQITTLPVYSKIADDTTVPVEVKQPLPADLRLSQHQLETYQALAGGQYDVVINTAMTGDGKSLAAQLQTLVNGRSLLMMYPTNELVRDQEMQVAQTLSQWGQQAKVRPTTMTGDRLREIVAAGQFSRKADVIKSLAANNEILLTNPDIFHYMAQFFYTRRGDSPDMLFARAIVDMFDLFVLDEFHIFQAPQIVAVLNAMLLIREITGQVQPKRFLFLSATPGGLLGEYLEKAGFRVKTIAPAADELYLHTFDRPDETLWRPIIRGSEINFWTARAEEWAEAHLADTLLAFFKEHGPGAKGAFIVNSVATAHRLVDRLGPEFAREGLRVLPNTGLTSNEVRKASREADLLIGTSTVDVGVDFRINFLVFESRDAGTFLQRLGRLGRHNDDGHGHRFEQFTAHALAPNFVQERLFVGHKDDPAWLADGAQFTREQLSAAIRSAYPIPFEFRAYAQTWGWIQSAHVYAQLFNPTVKDTYTDVRERLKTRYWETFRFSAGKILHDYKELRSTKKPIVEEAQSFRGGSPFACGVIDDRDGKEVVLSYDLFSLAANADLTWLEPEEFAWIARSRGALLSQTDVTEMAGWFRLRGFADARRNVTVMLNQPVAAWGADEFGQVRVITGVTLDVPAADWLNDLNRHLRQRQFVALLCLCPPKELIYKLRLPPMFEIYPFISRDSLEGSIAFARDALMLQVAIAEKRFSCGGGAMIL